MDERRVKFLTAVLGVDGAKALQKAAERSTELGNALVPRTILAWLGSTRGEYEGELPGLERTHVSFSKSEVGYSGSVTIADETYSFEKASLFHLAASVAVAIGVKQEPMSDGLRDIDIEKLGKSIDLLARARTIKRELAKVSPPGKFNDLPEKLKDKGYSADSAFAIAWSQHNKTKKDEIEPGKKLRCPECESDIYQTKNGKVGFHSHDGKKCSGSGCEPKPLEKKDDPCGTMGPSSKPQAPQAPNAPVAVAPQAPAAKPKISKPATAKPAKPVASNTLKITKAETERLCPVCSGHNFKGVYFVGCMCFKELAKFAKFQAAEDGLQLVLGPEWDRDAVLTFLESIGRS